MLFRAQQFEFTFPRSALVMGIVNITPDSFSDGRKFLNADAAIRHALEMVEQGAEILDIGGESTRPNAKPVSEKEELRRVIPVIEKLAEQVGSSRCDDRTARRAVPTKQILISIDTMKPAVARAALEAGASIVNDVAANRDNDEMWKIVSEFRAGYICMHAPQKLHKIQKRKNIVAEVERFFRERLKKMKAAGIALEQIIFDPGIGFGKTLDQNLQLLASLRRFTKLRRPVLLGVSRKSFIGKLTGADVNQRLPASLACATLGIEAGAQIIRAHDVAETVQAVRMTEAVLAKK
ncbi:MAG TPA: dihydropteroate synthase [Methylomirabilota bacterium]|nr:dihydropteroate synthase [Methylomirabilota bacterium]